MDQTYMKEQPVLKLIVSMALPMVISMMVSSLYNIVDSFFIARISEDAMTALSLVYPVQNLINAVMISSCGCWRIQLHHVPHHGLLQRLLCRFRHPYRSEEHTSELPVT